MKYYENGLAKLDALAEGGNKPYLANSMSAPFAALRGWAGILSFLISVLGFVLGKLLTFVPMRPYSHAIRGEIFFLPPYPRLKGEGRVATV